ncbi:MAG TPA: hemerythrin domain-containing protein [Egibacteraceae bacterium]|jgi:hemerythrin superfamily protein|nr:hemerythrin domain-containing protein [Egibacteraceae bacterium]
MESNTDAIELLTRDHRHIETLFEQYEGTTDVEERTKIAHEVVHDLAVHGEIEELLFYPRLRAAVPDGEALADEAVDEHLEIKQTLNEVDKMTADEAGFDQRMQQLVSEVRHHVEEEESTLFPRVREALSADELASLGRALDGARSIVPTRPHPSAPTGPIGKLAAAPAAALVDRVRDAVRSRLDDRS